MEEGSNAKCRASLARHILNDYLESYQILANDKCSVFVPLIDISFDVLVKKDLSVEIQLIVKSKTNFAKKKNK